VEEGGRKGRERSPKAAPDPTEGKRHEACGTLTHTPPNHKDRLVTMADEIVPFDEAEIGVPFDTDMGVGFEDNTADIKLFGKWYVMDDDAFPSSQPLPPSIPPFSRLSTLLARAARDVHNAC